MPYFMSWLGCLREGRHRKPAINAARHSWRAVSALAKSVGAALASAAISAGMSTTTKYVEKLEQRNPDRGRQWQAFANVSGVRIRNSRLGLWTTKTRAANALSKPSTPKRKRRPGQSALCMKCNSARTPAQALARTVGETWNLWLDQCEADNLERSTVRQRRIHLKHHVAPFIGTVKLSDLSTPFV